MIVPETAHIIGRMKATGNRQGLIEQWKADVAAWAAANPADPNAIATRAWLPLWQTRPFYTAAELAPMWPALAIATGHTARWPAVEKSARRLANELDYYRLPRLPAPWFDYFICERIHHWTKAPIDEIKREIENVRN